jgi:DHA2 family multidrug resistance protein
MAVMIGPAIGPTLGGLMVDHWSWPWIFYINVPVGALAVFMVTNFVHEPDDIRLANREAAAKQRKNMDWVGIALLSVGLCTFQYALEEGQRNDWFDSRLITGCFIVSLFCLALFAVREFSAPVPAVDLRLFRDRLFLSGTLIGGVMFAMLMSLTFLLPVFMQEVLGFTATQSGLALMPRTLIMMVVTPFIGKFYNKVSPRLVVGFGVVLFAISAYQMSHYTLDTGSGGIVAALLIQGTGFACIWVPLTTVALTSIPRHKMSDATGSNSLVRQIGGSVGLAIFATLLSRSQSTARGGLIAHLNPGNPDVLARVAGSQRMLQARGGLDMATARTTANAMLEFAVDRQASVLAFEKMFLLAGLLFLLVLPLLVFLKAPKEEGEKKEKIDVHVEL